MPASSLGVKVGCAAPLPNRALQLFVIANAGFNPPFQTGPGVETTWKVSDQSTAAWADWTGFFEGEQAGAVGPGARSVAAAPLTDGRIQVFIAVVGTNVSRLMTRWKETTDVNAQWTEPVNFGLPAGQGISRIAAGRLSDGRIQLFATTATAVFTSWKNSTNPNDMWSPWQTFYSRPTMTRLPRHRFLMVACSYGALIEMEQCGAAGKSRLIRMPLGRNGRYSLLREDSPLRLRQLL